MYPRPFPRAAHVRIVRGVQVRACAALACVLMWVAPAACSSAPHIAKSNPAVPTTTISTVKPQSPASSPVGVYALTLRTLDVLSPANGTIQHSYPVAGTVVSPMMIAGGNVYFVVGGTPSGAAMVMALRATDGSEVWRFPVPDVSGSAGLSVVDGMVIVNTSGFPVTVYALNARDGHKVWQVQEDAIIRSPAVAAGGVVYLAVQPNDGKQHLLALRATDGRQLWDFLVPTCGVLNSPAVDKEMVYLACETPTSGTPGDVYGVRAVDGKLMWHDGSLGLSVFRPSAGHGAVYVNAGGCGPIPKPACPPLYIYSLDEQTGAVRWRIQGSASDVVVAATALYCDLDDALVALDPATGAVRWRYSLANLHRLESSSLILAGGVLYFEGDEQILAVAATTGTLLWRSPALVDQSNPTLALFVVPQG